MLITRPRSFDPHRLATLVAAIAVAAMPVAASAADPAPITNGGMTFPNVRVINTPAPAADPAVAGEAQGVGLRAFVDPQTGKLREGTREEIDALNAAGLKDARGTTSPMAGVRVLRMKNGATVARLGDSQMLYSVVRRVDGNGLAEACVTGEAQALAWMGSDAPVAVGARRIGQGESQ